MIRRTVRRRAQRAVRKSVGVRSYRRYQSPGGQAKYQARGFWRRLFG